MNNRVGWRAISPEESQVIRTILSRAAMRGSDVLTAELETAVVASATPWILDIKVTETGACVELPNGPYPAFAYVPNSDDYTGEILVWISDGHLSGLEYAWVTDELPTRWPRPDEIDVVPRIDA